MPCGSAFTARISENRRGRAVSRRKTRCPAAGHLPPGAPADAAWLLPFPWAPAGERRQGPLRGHLHPTSPGDPMAFGTRTRRFLAILWVSTIILEAALFELFRRTNDSWVLLLA